MKFIGLGLIGALFFAMGGRIEALAIPFVGTVTFPMAVSFFITVFWLVAISNAFNLIDGMDGLATGAALFASIVILIVSLGQSNPLMIVVALVLCGALAGFLRYNFNPASIFLGDSGALFIGFLLAALSVLSAQKATTSVAVITPLLAFGLPVVDTTITMARRLISGKPMFRGRWRTHTSHVTGARLVSKTRGADSLCCMRDVRISRRSINQHFLAANRIRLVCDCGSRDDCRGTLALSRSRRIASGHEADCRRPAFARGQ